MLDQRRVVIDHVSPSVNCGQFYIKRVVNEIVNVDAHVLADISMKMKKNGEKHVCDLL